MKNRFGLSRNIPRHVKRTVRQRCGFGCVICGNAIYDYEHFDPEFKDCKEHSENGITLLCLRHHGKKGRDFLAQKIVVAANANPKAKQKGFWENFDFGDQYPKLLLGSNELFNCQNIILIDGESILRIDPPEEAGSPFRLSGRFYDAENNEIFEIIDNEWTGPPDLFDVETTAGEVLIKAKNNPETVALKISTTSLPDKLIISHLNMNYKGHKFIVAEDKFIYESPIGGRFVQVNNRTRSSVLQKSFMIKIEKDELKFCGIDV